MAHINAPAPSELIRTSTFGIPVTTELNTRCIKVNGEIGAGVADVANQWMTGALTINAAPTLKLRASGDTPTIRFENTTGASQLATVAAAATQLNYNVVSASGEHRFLVAGTERFKVDNTGAVMAGVTSSARGTFGSNGEQVRLIDTSTSGSDFHDCYIGYYGAGVSLASPGVRTGYVGFGGTSTMSLKNEVLDGDASILVAGSGTISLITTTGGVAISSTTGTISLASTTGGVAVSATTGSIALTTTGTGDINLTSGDQVKFTVGGTLQGLMDGAEFMWGKAASDLANAGIEMFGAGSSAEGSIRSTTDDASNMNLYARHGGSADASGQAYAHFARTGGTVIGSITQNGTTGTAFNTTSDRRSKTIQGPIVDALERVGLLRPYRVTWIGDPGRGECDALIADEVQPIIPDAVTGTADAVYSQDEADAMGVAVGSPKLQQLDYGRLTTLLVAGLQELVARVEDLEGN